MTKRQLSGYSRTEDNDEISYKTDHISTTWNPNSTTPILIDAPRRDLHGSPLAAFIRQTLVEKKAIEIFNSSENLLSHVLKHPPIHSPHWIRRTRLSIPLLARWLDQTALRNLKSLLYLRYLAIHGDLDADFFSGVPRDGRHVGRRG